MKFLLVLVALTGVFYFFHDSQVAQAQIGGTGISPETAPVVGVAPEAPVDPRVILKLNGLGCDDINAVESVVLHLRGIAGVDIETMKGHLIVDYDPKVVTPQQIMDALGRKKGCSTSVVTGGAGVQ